MTSINHKMCCHVRSLSYRIDQVDTKMMMLLEKYKCDRSFLDAFEYIESKSEYQNKEYKAKKVESLINSIDELESLISGEGDWWWENHYIYLCDYMKKDKNTLELLGRLLVLERDHS